MLGKFRGKVGATVFRTEAGIGQIASEYNPSPKNPRTLAQTKQRSKMNLAGLYSKLVGYPLIAGLGSNGRTARSRFVSNIIKSSTVTGTGAANDPIIAAITPEKVIFSDGGSFNGTMTEPFRENNEVSFSVKTNPAAPLNADAIIAIAVIAKGGVVVEVASYAQDLTNAGMTTGVVIPTNTSMNGNDVNVDVYAVPILKTDGATSAMFDYELGFSTNTYNVSVARTLAVANAYGNSIYLGKATTE